MKKELKQAIVNFIFENERDFQVHNATTKEFKNYIYNDHGAYLIGGEDVSEFISKAITILINY